MAKLSRLEHWLVIGALVILLGAAFSPVWGSRRNKHCILCRTYRVEHNRCGIRWDSDQENGCTEWYRDRVAPTHEHLWVRTTSPVSYVNLFGQIGGVASNLSYGPARALTPEQQRSVFEHIPDVQESQKVFVQLRDDILADRDRAARARAAWLVEWVVVDQFRTPWKEWQLKLPSDLTSPE